MPALIYAYTSNAQQYKWIKGGGPSNDFYKTVVRNMCTDAHNNLYMTVSVGTPGIFADSFYMTHIFGTGAYDNELLISYNCDGQMRWAKAIDANKETYYFGVTYDGGKNLYNTGTYNYYSTEKYIGYDTEMSCPYNASMLAKLDTSGKLKWVRFLQPDTTGTYGDPIPASIDVDSSKNVHVFCIAPAHVPLSSTISTGLAGNYDIIYDSLGNVVNATRLSTDTSIYYPRLQKAILNKRTGNIVAWLNYGTSALTVRDYIAEFNPTGAQIWADTGGLPIDSIGRNSILDIATDTSGNVYFTGTAGRAFIFGKDTIYQGNLVIKLDRLGAIKWSFGLYGTFLEGVAAMPNGNIAITGDVGPIGLIHGTDTIKFSDSTYGVLVGIIDSNGNTVFLDKLHTSSDAHDSRGNAVTSDNNNNLYAAGYLWGGKVSAVGAAPYVSDGRLNFIVAKFGSCNCSPGPNIASFFTKSRTDSVHFNYYGSPADSVRWYFDDGTTSTEINPIHAYIAKSTYHVCVTAYGCNDSAMFCDTVSALGILRSTSSYQQEAAWPNPTTGIIHVTVSSLQSAVYSVQITDIVGRILLTDAITSGMNQIDLSGLKSGMYFLQVRGKDGLTQTAKLMKE